MLNTFQSAITKAKQSYVDALYEDQVKARVSACCHFHLAIGEEVSREVSDKAKIGIDGFDFTVKLPGHRKIWVGWTQPDDISSGIRYRVECCPKIFTNFAEALLEADPNFTMRTWLSRFWRKK